MSTDDKIIELLKHSSPLSSRSIFEKLKQNDPEFHDAYRTVQSKITNLLNANVIESHTVRLVALYSRKSSDVSRDYFMDHVWNELFQIKEQMHHQTLVSGGGFDHFVAVKDRIVFERLYILMKMLPRSLKEEVEPEFEKVVAVVRNNTRPDSQSSHIQWPLVDSDSFGTQREFESKVVLANLFAKVTDALHSYEQQKKSSEKEKVEG